MRLFVGPDNATAFISGDGDPPPGFVEVDQAAYDAANGARDVAVQASAAAAATAFRSARIAALEAAGFTHAQAVALAGGED